MDTAASPQPTKTEDWLIFGPGSWYTSVLPHLMVPELAAAIVASPARKLVTLNLAADNETLGLSVADHLAALIDRYAAFGKTARNAIDESGDAGDADTADIFTEVSRGIDKQLWFIEAHVQEPTGDMRDGDGA